MYIYKSYLLFYNFLIDLDNSNICIFDSKLGLEYLDLYLIHWPIALKTPGIYKIPCDTNDIVPLDIQSVWEAMEECQAIGLTKLIGVSNFSRKKIDNLLATAKIPPAVNQVSSYES